MLQTTTSSMVDIKIFNNVYRTRLALKKIWVYTLYTVFEEFPSNLELAGDLINSKYNIILWYCVSFYYHIQYIHYVWYVLLDYCVQYINYVGYVLFYNHAQNIHFVWYVLSYCLIQYVHYVWYVLFYNRVQYCTFTTYDIVTVRSSRWVWPTTCWQLLTFQVRFTNTFFERTLCFICSRMTLFDQMLLSNRLLLSNKYTTMLINSFNLIEVVALLRDNRDNKKRIISAHNSRRILNKGIAEFILITDNI